MRDYAQTGDPFPERRPVAAMTGRFFLEYADLVARWPRWARKAAGRWEGVSPPAAAVPDGPFDLGSWPFDRAAGADERRHEKRGVPVEGGIGHSSKELPPEWLWLYPT
jgi:hypothetical protein